MPEVHAVVEIRGFDMKQYIKQPLLYLLRSLGVFERERKRNRSRLVVLCYHSIVSDDSPFISRTNIAVSAGMFEKQLQLIRNRWNPVSLKEIETACLEKKPLPDYSVFVSFDDGFRNNFTLAAPLLKKYGVPAVVFLTTGLIGNNALLWPQEVKERLFDGTEGKKEVFFPAESCGEKPNETIQRVSYSRESDRFHFTERVVSACKKLSQENRMKYLEALRQVTTLDTTAPWKKELYEFMSWNEVRAIREFGVDLGAHTISHPILSSLTQEKLRDELRLCKEKIESEVGGECFSLAYPNGGKADFNATVIEEANQAGFRIAFNLYEKRNPSLPNAMSIDRFCITRDLSMLEFEKLLGKG